MKKTIYKIVSAALAFSCLCQSAVLAKTDYANVYEYEYMDDVYRYDTGEYRGGGTGEADAEYIRYMNILSAMGFTSFGTRGGVLRYDDFAYTIAALRGTKPEKQEADEQKPVLMEDAADYLTDILGYKKLYPGESVEERAKTTGVTDGVVYDAKKEITTGEFAVLVWNTLNAEYVTAKIEEGTQKLELSDKSLLEDKFEIVKVKGFVDGIYKKNLLSQKELRKDEIYIDRTSYHKGNSGAEQYLGMRIEAYVQNEDDEYTILYAEPEKGDGTVTVDFKNIAQLDDYIYYTLKDGTEKRVPIGDIKYIVNNWDVTTDMSILDNYENMDGEVTVSKSQKNGKYDCLIVKEYTYATVMSVNTHSEKIGLNYGVTINGKSEIDMKNPDLLICQKNGEDIDWKEIAVNDVIRVMQNSDGSFREIIVSSEKVSGRVSAFDEDSNKVTIDKRDYYLASSYRNSREAEEIKLNSTGSFYISKDKYIAGFKPSSQYSYAYLRKLWKDEDSEDIYAYIFTELGEWKTYTLKDKLTLDGRANVTADAALDLIKDNKMVDRVIRYKAKEGETTMDAGFSVTTLGEISFIDTFIDNFEEQDDEYRLLEGYKGTITLGSSATWVKETQYSLMGDAVVFRIPSDLNKTEQFSVTSGSAMGGGNTLSYVEMYTPNDFLMCRAGTAGTPPAQIANENEYWMYVKSVGEGLDEEDENVYVLKGILVNHNNKKKSQNTENYQLTCRQSLKELIDLSKKDWLKPGTLLRVSFDQFNVLKAASVIFTDNTCDEFYDSVFNYYNSMCGYVTAVDPTLGKYGYMKVRALEDEYVLQPGGNIIMIDTAEDDAYISSLAEVKVGDKMYVHYAANDARMCVVFR